LLRLPDQISMCNPSKTWNQDLVREEDLRCENDLCDLKNKGKNLSLYRKR